MAGLTLQTTRDDLPVKSARRLSLVDASLVILNVAIWISFLLRCRSVLRIDHIPGRTVFLYDRGYLVVGTVAALLAILHILTRRRADTTSALYTARARSFFLPIMILAAIAMIPLYPVAASNLLFLGSPAIAAGALVALWKYARQCPKEGVAVRIAHGWVASVLVYSALYWWMGLYFTKHVGQHSGDEGHYITQAESLYHDGDLDLRNSFDAETSRLSVHISRNSLHNKWYSWHTPGLSFLMAPTVGGGIVWRHAVLGIISGLGIAGVFWLACLWGADRCSAHIAAALLGLGPFWGVYASRALPETLGAALAVYGMIACFLQRTKPRCAVALEVVCVAYLPWAQTRFIPLAVTLIGCFGLYGLCGPEKFRVKAVRLGTFSLLCILALASYEAAQWSMFKDGLSYPVPDLLFSLPAGLWHTLASNRGIVYMFPLFACGLVSVPYLLWNKETRTAGFFSLLVFLSIWLTSCATKWFTAGACMPGRYLVVVTPVVAAALACALKNAGSGFRGLALFLGLVPAALFIVELSVLKQMGKAFSDPMMVEVVHPVFVGLMDFFYNPYATLKIMPAAMLYAAAALLLFVPNMRRSRETLLLALTAVVFLCYGWPQTGTGPRTNPRRTASFLQAAKQDNLHVSVFGDANEAKVLLDYSDLLYGIKTSEIKSVTSRDLGTLVVSNWVSTPHLTINDWDGHEYRWATLIPPFHAGHGRRAIYMDARNSGKSDVEIVIREGSQNRAVRTIPAGAIMDETLVFESGNTGDLYLLARLTGENGELEVRRISYSAYTDALLSKANMTRKDAR